MGPILVINEVKNRLKSVGYNPAELRVGTPLGGKPPGSSRLSDLFGCFIRDLFKGENVTSIWVIKRSLGRSWHGIFT